jgi:F-type H+-transporting ATPase subunit b
MDKIISDFGVQPVLLAAQIVNFLILLFILNKLLYKPLLKVLEQRRQKVEESIKNAEKIEQKLLKTEEEYEKRIVEASKEGQKIIDEATKSASQIVSEAHQKAQSDIEEMMQKGQASIRMERDRMQQEMREELSDVVVTALEKVTGKVINKTDQRKMVDQAVKGL